MKILQLEQGSKEWLEARLNYLCASEAPVIMGASKFMSRKQLLDLKKGWLSNPVSNFTQKLYDKGHEHEDMARDHLEFDLLEDIAPVVAINNVYGLDLLSSLDGWNGSNYLWEHKDWNEVLAENVRNGVLEPLYYWQLEHQCLTFNASEVNFMVSNGTLEKRVKMVYKSDPARRAELITAWKQFLIDLDGHEIEAKQELVKAGEVESFPVINFEVKGSVIISNIADCLPIIKERAELEMTRELETDLDFATKESLNKAVKVAREKLKETVSNVQGQFVSYSEFAITASDIDAILQKMQSHGEKQVKDQKAKKKQAIIDAGQLSIMAHITACDVKIAPQSIVNITGFSSPSFVDAMKNKRTIESWNNAVDDEVAKAKAILNSAMEKIEPNLAFIKNEAGDYKFLFNDLAQIINQESESFQAVVKMRIAEHKQAEAEKLEAERKRIQAEEEAKSQREAEAKAESERERIRSEERAKARQEVATKTQEELVVATAAVLQESPGYAPTHAQAVEKKPELPQQSRTHFSGPSALPENAELNLFNEVEAWAKRNKIGAQALSELHAILASKLAKAA